MFRTAGYALIFLAMFSIAGGHWAALQTAAWAKMVWEYSEEDGIVTALRQTLSGERPCRMCRAIEAGKQKETRIPASENLTKKFEITLSGVELAVPLRDRRDVSYPPGSHLLFSLLTFAPPSPVPRSAAA